MELEFDVKINAAVLYDYMLYHTYSSPSGLIGAIAGAFLIIIFAAKGYALYLIAGIVVLAYLPVTLYIKAKRQAVMTPAFKNPLHYRMDEGGVSVSQGDSHETQGWDSCYKAVSTSKSIILYTSRTTASIFPRKDIAGQSDMLIQMISTHMPPDRVKIKR